MSHEMFLTEKYFIIYGVVESCDYESFSIGVQTVSKAERKVELHLRLSFAKKDLSTGEEKKEHKQKKSTTAKKKKTKQNKTKANKTKQKKSKQKKTDKQTKKRQSNKNCFIQEIVSKATIHIYSGREMKGLLTLYRKMPAKSSKLPGRFSIFLFKTSSQELTENL